MCRASLLQSPWSSPRIAARTWRRVANVASRGASRWACWRTASVSASTVNVAWAPCRESATQILPSSVAKTGASRYPARMDYHHRFSLQALGLVGSPDEDPGCVGKTGSDRARLFDLRSIGAMSRCWSGTRCPSIGATNPLLTSARSRPVVAASNAATARAFAELSGRQSTSDSAWHLQPA
jgi:hypothetical protein